MRFLAATALLSVLSLFVTGCDDSSAERDERAAHFTTSTKPAPNPQRESLDTYVRKDAAPQTGWPGAPVFELYSEYKGEDIRQVTGVSGRTLILMFTAPWCEYCGKMRRAMNDLAQQEKGNVQVVEVNADEYPVLAEQFGITKVPTLFIYAEGVKLRTIEGAYNARSVRKSIHNLLSQGDGGK